MQGINCIRLFRKYKQEQMDRLREEREKIEAERAESQKMMAELQALKAQIAGQQTNTALTVILWFIAAADIHNYQPLRYGSLP